MATASLSNTLFRSTKTGTLAQPSLPAKQEPKKKKPIRQAVGIVVMDPITRKVLMISSRKRDDALVLPRGDCQLDPAEHPEKAAIRILLEEAGVSVDHLSRRIGTFTEANKKGKIVAHHWMFEVHAPTLLAHWPSGRSRAWVTFDQALLAVSDRRIAYMALNSSSLSHSRY